MDAHPSVGDTAAIGCGVTASLRARTQARSELIEELLDWLAHRLSLVSLRFLGGRAADGGDGAVADVHDALSILRVMTDLLGHDTGPSAAALRGLDWPNSIADGIAACRHLVQACGASFTSSVSPALPVNADLAGRLLAQTLVQLCREAAASAVASCDIAVDADADMVRARVVVHGHSPDRPPAPPRPHIAARTELLGGSLRVTTAPGQQIIDLLLPSTW